jgi:hypothetical protein
MEKGTLCNYCGIIESDCNIKNNILKSLNIYLINDLSNIVIKYLKCENVQCKNILHKSLLCCDYMCECEEYDCNHFIKECSLGFDLNRLVCL